VTFRPSLINAEFGLGWAQAGGATIDGEGNAFVAWASYARSGPGKGAAALYVSKSEDGGASWSTRLLDTSMAAPGCERFKCGWGYLGAQIAMTSDGAGTLYALWNAGRTAYGAQKIYFSSSTTAGDTWSAKSAIANAGAGTEQAFPAVVAGDAGDVRIAWMDKRRGLLWNTYYRSSTNGGASWSTVVTPSGYRRGYRYIHRGGFDFPFGDYFGLAIDGDGNTQAAWGEGLNFDSPGSIWYASGR